ncbi:MAG: protocatechuate 3,4-dioxygenase [Gammaproteobacteria bacterium]|nr:protocatechuate 3,4-dioxygenase [Gammaproteobacteria bacterium]
MNPSKSFSRREMLEMAAALGCLAVTLPLNSVLAQEGIHPVTPGQIMGPFYPVIRPLDHDMDLTVIKGKRGHAQGKVVHLTGRILNSRGEPVRAAKVEVWQANTHGRYAHPTDVNPAPLDPNFQGFGVQITDREGRFRFKTIKPGAYPINPMNPSNMRPPHIHFDVIGAKDRLVTQMYFPDEPLNESDILFKALGSEKDAAIAKVLPLTKELESDSLLINWDVVLKTG